MRKLTQAFCFLLLCLLSSCSVYEDIYFAENGSIKYELAIDANELIQAIPDFSSEANKIPADTVFSFVDMINSYNEKNSEEQDAEKKKDMEYLTPLSFKIHHDPATNNIYGTLLGDFENIEKFNKTQEVLHKYYNNERTFTSNQYMKGEVSVSTFTWDGKTLKRTPFVPNDISKDVDSNDNSNDDMQKMMSMGKFTTRYHFPEKVVNVNNPNALLSLDGKTVSITYPLSAFQKTSNELDIEISTAQ